jgi:NADPH-dependent glutamate synthase beta subunit-like oxidoreductase
MGHKTTVFEMHKQLGGMLRYGIPYYRLPDEEINKDLDAIVSTGVEIKYKTTVGDDVKDDISIEQLKKDYDAVLITIGAHLDKKLRIDGEDSQGVYSAVELLGRMGDNDLPDFKGKNVVVVGGGNVAMDATRTSVRLGAKNVKCVYRRRIEDMTALYEEIEGAMAEGAEVVELEAPVSVETNNGKVSGLVVQPQMISTVKRGRPAPITAKKPEHTIDCDIIVVAIGQDINSKPFEKFGIPTEWKQISAGLATNIEGFDGFFSAGDCVSGPATAIKAVEAGKVAARNIDNYLGFNNEISLDVDIPKPSHKFMPPCGRIKMLERDSGIRKNDFDLMELPMSAQEIEQETSRCLRCDFNGFGALKNGRQFTW